MNIIINYFHSKLPHLDYEQGQIIAVDDSKLESTRNEIVSNILNADYNVMLRKHSDSLIISIDKGNFKQR